MRSFGALLSALVSSGLIAAAVQILLGVALRIDLALLIAMALLAVMTPLTTLVLGIALGAASTAAWIDRMAVALLGLVALAVIAVLMLEFRALHAITITRSTLMWLVAMAVPLVIMIGIQWWLIRRRWLLANAKPSPPVTPAA